MLQRLTGAPGPRRVLASGAQSSLDQPPCCDGRHHNPFRVLTTGVQGKRVAIKKIHPMAQHMVDAKHVLREIRLMR